MGLLKKIGKAVGSFIFVMFLITAISVYSLAQFTDYDTAKPTFTEIIQVQLEKQMESEGGDLSGMDIPGVGQVPEGVEIPEDMTEEEAEVYRQILSEACKGEDTIEMPLAQGGEFGGVETITIDCNEFREMERQMKEEATEQTGEGTADTTDFLAETVAEDIFDSFYYKEYDCGFIECILKGEQLVIMSAQGNKFFNSLKMILWAGAAAGAALVIVCAEGWPDRLKSFGWPMTLTGISYFLIGFIKDLIINKLPLARQAEQAGIQLSQTIDMFMKPTMDGLLVVFIAGVCLTASGYVIEYYQKKKGIAPAAKPKTKPKTKSKTKPKKK